MVKAIHICCGICGEKGLYLPDIYQQPKYRRDIRRLGTIAKFCQTDRCLHCDIGISHTCYGLDPHTVSAGELLVFECFDQGCFKLTFQHRHTQILDPTALGCRKSHFKKIPTTLGAMTYTTQKMNVESFNLDHRAVAAPFVRIADRKELPGGDVLVKYDVRFKQPNVEHLEMPTVHSLEHMLAEHLRNHTDA